MKRLGVLRTYRWLLLGLLLVVIAAGATLVIQRQEARSRSDDDATTLSAHSNVPDGARALRLWLGEIGYQATTLEYRPFRLDQEQRLVFLLAPTEELKAEHVAEIEGWVEQGGTLIVVPGRDHGWLGSFGVEIVSTGANLEHARAVQPLPSPPVGLVRVETTAQLRLLDPAWVPLLGAPDQHDWIVAVTRALGAGRISVLTSELPMSNAGLRDRASAALVLNLLQGIPADSALVFDEYHHGATEYGSLQARMVREPWGWAIFYVGALGLAFLALAGRRFGPALPALPRGARRARAEYVTTLAGMFRAGNHRDWLRRQYTSQVRHTLARHFRIPPDLPVAEFVTALASQRPEAGELARPLQQLEAEVRDDATTIRLIRQIETVRARLLGLPPISRAELRARVQPDQPSRTHPEQPEAERPSVMNSL